MTRREHIGAAYLKFVVCAVEADAHLAAIACRLHLRGLADQELREGATEAVIGQIQHAQHRAPAQGGGGGGRSETAGSRSNKEYGARDSIAAPLLHSLCPQGDGVGVPNQWPCRFVSYQVK
jgi:hypothetical protein